MRVLNGEDVPSASTNASSPPKPDTPQDPDADQFDFDTGSLGDRALDQEIELARLERENVVLRRMLGLELRESEYGGDIYTGMSDQHRLPIPRPLSAGVKKVLGGAPGTVGPYGTYKRRVG